MGEHISSLSCQSHSSRARRVQQSKGIKSSYKVEQEAKSHKVFVQLLMHGVSCMYVVFKSIEVPHRL
jgi:predicted metal-binding protein